MRKANTGFETDIESSSVVARNSAESKSLIINFVPLTHSADSINRVVSFFAAAKSILEDLINTTSQNAVSLSILRISSRADAGYTDCIKGRISFALLADTIDFEVSGSALANSLNNVVDLVSKARDTADCKVSIIESISWAFLANIVDQMERSFTNTESIDFKSIRISTDSRLDGSRRSLSRRSGFGDAHSTIEIVSIDAITSMMEFIIDSVFRAGVAFSIDILESSDTDAGKTGKIELLFSTAGRSANAELSIIVIRRNAVSTNSFHEIEVRKASTDVSY